ncbi:hypothetical protein [Prevotella dentasini]
MKRIISFAACLLLTLSAWAQADVVSMKDAIAIFQKKTLYTGKQILEKQGYTYKGLSTDNYGKDHNWVKNMDLTKDFLPTSFKKGNSSMVLLSEGGNTLYVYVFNRAAYAGLQSQVRNMGYDMGNVVKSTSKTLICTKDGMPTITFLELQDPLPYCVQITE